MNFSDIFRYNVDKFIMESERNEEDEDILDRIIITNLQDKPSSYKSRKVDRKSRGRVSFSSHITYVEITPFYEFMFREKMWDEYLERTTLLLC